MKEYPILFSGEMVRAILDGRKTQTRRLAAVRKCDGYRGGVPGLAGDVDGSVGAGRLVAGDRLWVRENWAAVAATSGHEWATGRDGDAGRIRYRATWDRSYGRWRPSIHMPRWASRLTLEVVDRRPERLQAIGEWDARSEGMQRAQLLPPLTHWNDYCKLRGCIDCLAGTYRGGFANLWERINGKRAPWASDPWVWVISFRVLGGETASAEACHG